MFAESLETWIILSKMCSGNCCHLFISEVKVGWGIKQTKPGVNPIKKFGLKVILSRSDSLIYIITII